MQRSFPSLVLGTLGSPCFLILLIYAIHKDGYSQSNHSQITRSKNSYSLIQPLPLPCTPACGHQFHALTFNHLLSSLPSNLQHLLVGSAFEIRSKVCDEAFLRKQSKYQAHWVFKQRSSIVYIWRNSKCDILVLCLRRFQSLGFHKGILNSPWMLILLIHTKDKDNKMKILDWPTSSFPSRRSIHWVDKTRNVWLIVGQLPIKDVWWDAPLSLRDFSRSNTHNYSTRI